MTLLGMTLLVPDWIEAVFGINPDQHNGSFEWAIIGLLLTATVACGVLARLEWRRPRSGARA
jgi:Mg2+ and Co2+ transporter CorA